MAGGIPKFIRLAVLAAGMSFSGIASQAEAALLGQRGLPDFRQPRLEDGLPWDSASLRGHVSLVILWAPWCTICLAEWPDLVVLYQRLSPSGLRCVALTMDAPTEPADRKDLARRLDLPFPVVSGDEGLRRRFRGVRGYPTLVLADRDGIIRHQWAGPPPAGELEAAVRSMIRPDRTEGQPG
ncbi:MAG: TlpA family protein disulfide reductase [Candidatus Sericytochromatia bacterium]|nr:TlpA family protein disulfide reductase [Candidatus Tanganyikabacteria bacterium]